MKGRNLPYPLLGGHSLKLKTEFKHCIYDCLHKPQYLIKIEKTDV